MEKERAIILSGWCGRQAPRRRTGDRSEARYPSRTGTPLCVTHRRFAHDDVLFPAKLVDDGAFFASEPATRIVENQDWTKRELERLSEEMSDETRCESESP